MSMGTTTLHFYSFSTCMLVVMIPLNVASLMIDLNLKKRRRSRREREREGEWTGLHLITHVFMYVFVMLSILQSQSIEKVFKKAKTFEHTLVLLFLFMLEEKGKKSLSPPYPPTLPPLKYNDL